MKRWWHAACVGATLALALAPHVAATPLSSATSSPAPSALARRHAFLGAFFRAQGAPPYGVFAPRSRPIEPAPYPEPSRVLFGTHGYCDAIAPNGVSISSGYEVDAAKLADVVDLGVGWTRTTVSSFFDDRSHFDRVRPYAFADFDSAQCALVRHRIAPLVDLAAGPVMYDAVPGTYSPASSPQYRTASDFAAWCDAVATHERERFPSVHRYSLPGNEVNTNPGLFPGGDAQIAAYARACYRAIKRVDAKAFVYGFELNMDSSAAPAAFVRRLYDLGCRAGTCYDALSIHLSLDYPVPPIGTPCAPHPGGKAAMSCIDDIRAAAHRPIHVIVGETVYTVPGSVPDEATKAKAIVAEFRLFAARPDVDGASYANVDECAMYARGYFARGCLVDTSGTRLPAFTALRSLAARSF